MHEAIVLAAGDGDRFRQTERRSKLLTPIGGIPLLVRTLVSAYRAGITTVHLVVGYDAAQVVELAESAAPRGLRIHPHVNRDWHLENGVSVLAARACLHDRRFALLMGDHVFDDEVLARLLAITPEPGETLLCVDRRPVPVEVAREATRVRMDGRRITAIGKNVEPFDALDTGLFVCDPSLFEALKASCREGDTTLSGGMRRLTASELVAGIDIGEGFWCDIDTVDDLAHAERLTRQPTRVDAASPARSAASGSVA